MHEARYVSISEGGSEPRRTWQAASLFGLEYFSRSQTAVARTHVYCAGRLEIRDDATAELTFWPREARRMQDGALQLVADSSCYLQQPGEHTAPAVVRLLRQCHPNGESSASPPSESGIFVCLVVAWFRVLLFVRVSVPSSVLVLL